MRQVARYADASNAGLGNLIGEAWGPVTDAPQARGPQKPLPRDRPPLRVDPQDTRQPRAEAGKNEAVSPAPRGAAAYYRVLVEAGVRYFITSVADAETLRLLAKEVVPEIARP